MAGVSSLVVSVPAALVGASMVGVWELHDAGERSGYVVVQLGTDFREEFPLPIHCTEVVVCAPLLSRCCLPLCCSMGRRRFQATASSWPAASNALGQHLNGGVNFFEVLCGVVSDDRFGCLRTLRVWSLCVELSTTGLLTAGECFLKNCYSTCTKIKRKN